MGTLSNKDLKEVLALTGRLHTCHDPAELRRLIVCGVHQLIGADRVTFEHFAPTVPALWAVAEPDKDYEPWMWEAFLAHIDEHPAIAHYRATGDLTALKISDFVAVREWHSTHLYQELYRPLGIEDQMGVCLAPPDREFYSVVLARSARSFTSRDRDRLNLLRGHIALAHDNARAFDRLARLNRQQEKAAGLVSQSAIMFDRRGHLLNFPARARKWLRAYCPDSRHEGTLPQPVDDWIRSSLTTHGSAVSEPLVLERKGRRLILRLRLGQPGPTIIAEEQSAPDAATLRALGLSPRQCRVLQEVEQGKTNAEIAAALFISPLTVRTHLANIFEILGVNNRTAAVAKMRRLL